MKTRLLTAFLLVVALAVASCAAQRRGGTTVGRSAPRASSLRASCRGIVRTVPFRPYPYPFRPGISLGFYAGYPGSRLPVRVSLRLLRLSVRWLSGVLRRIPVHGRRPWACVRRRPDSRRGARCTGVSRWILRGRRRRLRRDVPAPEPRAGCAPRRDPWPERPAARVRRERPAGRDDYIPRGQIVTGRWSLVSVLVRVFGR